MKFNFHSDPGHGWVKVPRKLLIELEIADKISQCSYQYGNFVYLEEDRDAGLFIRAMDEHNKPYSFKEHCCKMRYSPIRNYDSYQP